MVWAHAGATWLSLRCELPEASAAGVFCSRHQSAPPRHRSRRLRRLAARASSGRGGFSTAFRPTRSATASVAPAPASPRRPGKICAEDADKAPTPGPPGALRPHRRRSNARVHRGCLPVADLKLTGDPHRLRAVKQPGRCRLGGTSGSISPGLRRAAGTVTAIVQESRVEGGLLPRVRRTRAFKSGA